MNSYTSLKSSPSSGLRRPGMRARRAIGNTAGQVLLSVLGLLWILPLVYLLVQSFRAEPGAWSPGFFPRTWTLDNYKRLFTETPSSSPSAAVPSPRCSCWRSPTLSAVSASLPAAPL